MFTNFVFLTSILAVASAQVSHTCYPTGAGPVSDCAQFITEFCNDVAQNSFRVGDSGARCFNSSDGNRCDFAAFNSRNSAAAPAAVSCEAALNDVVQNCPLGGCGLPNPTNSFTYTVDPNTGPCVRGIQGGN